VMDRIAESKPGQVVHFTVLRDGKRLEVPVTIEEDLRFQHLRQKSNEASGSEPTDNAS